MDNAGTQLLSNLKNCCFQTSFLPCRPDQPSPNFQSKNYFWENLTSTIISLKLKDLVPPINDKSS